MRGANANRYATVWRTPMLMCCIEGYGHIRICWSLNVRFIISPCGRPNIRDWRFRSSSVQVVNLQSTGHSGGPGLTFKVAIFHLVIELMISRCAALSLFVSVNGGIPVPHSVTRREFSPTGGLTPEISDNILRLAKIHLLQQIPHLQLHVLNQSSNIDHMALIILHR
jgi:hypothetical protein